MKGELKSAFVTRQVGREQHSAAVRSKRRKHDYLRRKRKGEPYVRLHAPLYTE